MRKPLRKGLALIAGGLTITGAWFAYALLSGRDGSGPEIKDGAVLSVVPLGLSLVLIVWGVVLVGRARR